jgi:kynurenine formamidase
MDARLAAPRAAVLAAVLAGGLACAPAPAPPAPESGPVTAPGPAIDLARYELVDLTYPFDEETLYWPTSPGGFELEVLAHGTDEQGRFYAANRFAAPEHGGTHLDAPIHFADGRRTVEEIPLPQLVAPAVVLDVREQAAADLDYRLTRSDLAAWEAEHGRVPPGSIVLLHTGWGNRYPDRAAYFGDDTPGDASDLHFPAYGEEAAAMLVEERRVAVLGLDTPSLDHGPSTDFPVHRVAAAANVPGLENVAQVDRLPSTGAWVIALPMKIAGGTGGPVRIVALVPRTP